MSLPADPSITASEVLRAFHHDEIYLFLGSAFTTLALLSAALCVLRRKYDVLLIYFAGFALFYGQRLWITSDLLGMLVPNAVFFEKLRSAFDFFVPIFGFLFFNAAGFLPRNAKIAGYILSVIMGVLATATFIFGPSSVYHLINNVVAIAALIFIAPQLIWRGTPDRDFIIVRRGLLIFIVFALWDNFAGVFELSAKIGIPPKIEPFGFVAFLGTLGYVAARRALLRDQQLNEIQKELDVARRIQLSILPGDFPGSPHFRVAARYVPMTSVAGDFYDFIVGNDKQAGLLIADVSGHGVPAALIASMVKLAATSQRANASQPSVLLAGMNAALCGNTQSQFVTAAYVHLDSEARELRYSAAGHPPMLLLRGGKVVEIIENGLMLGAFDFAAYSSVSKSLESGDRLLLYTDGIVEAANAAGDFFGQEALASLLNETAGIPAAAAADEIVASVQRWSAAQSDDLTVVVCDYTEP